jgi:hypothetical protein
MLTAYRNIAILVVLIFLGVQWGFYVPYTSQFPDFKNATLTIHIHGAVLITWLLLLIVQPLLIQRGKFQLHRKIGNVSWVLGPLVIFMLFLVGRNSYIRHTGEAPDHVLLQFVVLDMRGWVSFAIFWALAMIYRKNSPAHMRYMIATGLIGIGPGIGRGLIFSFGLKDGPAILITDIITLSIVGGLLIYDIAKKKNYKPFLLVFLVFCIGALLWQMRETNAWQSFAKSYVNLMY